MASFRLGTARVDITPPVGTPMQGYAARTHGSTGVHDRLSATATAFDDGSRRAAIVSCDLIGLGRGSVRSIRSAAARLCHMDPGAIMVNCSHTHGGPATGGRSYVKTRADYLRTLERQVATTVALAVKDLEPAGLSTGVGEARIGANRRAQQDGKMVIGVNPEGPTDPEVLVLRADDATGAPYGLVFSYSCHGTTLGGDNYLTTADYVGYARSTMESIPSDRSCISSFLSGTAGNINPHPRGTFELARRQGITLGAEVLKASQWTQPMESSTISHAQIDIDLPLAPPPTQEVLRDELPRLEAELRAAKRRGEHNAGLKAQVFWRREMLRRIRTNSVKEAIRAEIQAIRIGDMGVVGLPGEVFVEIGLSLKHRSPFNHTIVSGYTNDNVGYIPTARAFEEGGYEPNSFVYLMEQKFEPGVEDVARESALRVLQATVE